MKKTPVLVVVAVVVVLILAIAACASPPAPATTAPAKSPTATPAPAATPTAKPTQAAPTPAPAKSTILNVTATGGVASAVYVFTAGISESMRKAVGIEMKPNLVTGDLAIVSALKDGVNEIGYIAPITLLAAFSGQQMFKDAKWAPQTDIRLIWRFTSSNLGICVRADSGIKDWKDIKGRTWAYAPSYSTSTLGAKSMVAYAGYKWSDIKEVKVSAYNEPAKSVNLGHADIGGPVTLVAAESYELESSRNGLRWLPVSASDTAAWDRFNAEQPFKGAYSAVWVNKGEGAGIPEGGMWAVSSASAYFAYASRDPELVYRVAKGITLTYPEWRDKFAGAWIASPRYNADPFYMAAEVPFHEGTVRWLKEIGCWTLETEKEQAKRLKAIGASK